MAEDSSQEINCTGHGSGWVNFSGQRKLSGPELLMLAVEACGVHGNSDLWEDLGVGIGYRKVQWYPHRNCILSKKKYLLCILVVAQGIFLAAHRLSSCGSGSAVAKHKLSCSTCGILALWPSIEPGSPALQDRLTSGLPGKSGACALAFQASAFCGCPVYSLCSLVLILISTLNFMRLNHVTSLKNTQGGLG